MQLVLRTLKEGTDSHCCSLQALDDLPLTEAMRSSGGFVTDILLPPPAESLYTLPRKKGGESSQTGGEQGTDQKARTVRFETGGRSAGATTTFQSHQIVPNVVKKPTLPSSLESFKKTNENNSGQKSESAV